jgi:hypothetical protein
MKKNQEQWMDEVLGSLQGMQAAEGNPHLHTRVMARLRQHTSRQPVQVKWVYAMAAVFTIMLLLNVMGWTSSATTDSSSSVDIETVINEYDTDISYISLP